jgi:hypothetical protein
VRVGCESGEKTCGDMPGELGWALAFIIGEADLPPQTGGLTFSAMNEGAGDRTRALETGQHR